MRVLLAVACLAAAAFAQETFQISPGAKSNTFLYQVQTEMIGIYRGLYPNGVRFDSTINLGIMTAKNDLCKINDERYQSHPSIIVGKTCKKEFVKLYNEDEDQCSGVFCDIMQNAETFVNDTMRALIAAETDDKFFDIVEEEIVDPMMGYSCRCLMKMLGAWIKCKGKIGEADIWATLMTFGGFDTSAEYLGGRDWKEYWVDLVVNRVPWDDIETLFDRTMANLCQRNTDKKGNAKCYSYFYNAFTKLYKWYLKATGMVPAVKKNAQPEDTDVPSHCTTYDLSAFSDMDVEDLTFGDIKDAVIDKFCVADCAPLYQRTLLGCCTASMIQDTALEEAVVNTAAGLAAIIVDVFPPEESTATTDYDDEDEEGFDITVYFDYYEDILGMLRDPTCDETGVSYDVTPCTEGSSQESSCDGLEGKQLKICKKKAKKGGEGGGKKKKGGKGGKKKNKGGEGGGKKNKGGKGKKKNKGGDQEA